MFSSCNPKFFAVRDSHYPVNPSNDYFHTDAVVPSSDHCDRVVKGVGHLGHYYYYCRKVYLSSDRVRNGLLSSYCSNLYFWSLWANYRKSCMSHFIVSYNNAFRILHNLHMRCSASFMFANAVVDSNCCSTCIRKNMFSLMSRLNTSTNDNCAEIPLLNYTKDGVIHLVPIFFHFTMDRMYSMLYLQV